MGLLRLPEALVGLVTNAWNGYTKVVTALDVNHRATRSSGPTHNAALGRV